MIAILIILLTLVYFENDRFSKLVFQNDKKSSEITGSFKAVGNTRNIVKHMDETGKDCVVFFGSQTGTAQDFASKLAKEGHARFGLKTMVADLEDYEYDTLVRFPDNKIAIFILATYGEGDPTDNAIDFYEFINEEAPEFSEDQEPPLGNLNYIIFGLGNSTYAHYNSVVRKINQSLERLGAKRIGTVGEGDDGTKTMEEDFLAWKELMWSSLGQQKGLKEQEAVFEPEFTVVEQNIDHSLPAVFQGELNKYHLSLIPQGPYNAHNPYIAPIAKSEELFTTVDRNCLHIEFDICGSGLSYNTGDHLALWPMNPDFEVTRFLKVMGLFEKKDVVINIRPRDLTVKVPFPSPTTYEAAVRHYLEICAPVSRQFVATLAAFSPDQSSKHAMKRLGEDKDEFHRVVTSRCLNIAKTLESICNTKPWSEIPFSAVIEGLSTLQPRYYSISSSSFVQQEKVSVTAVVSSLQVPSRTELLKGITTNYLLALKQRQHGNSDPVPHGTSYALDGPRKKYKDNRVPIHIRPSNFKLPSDNLTPIVMVGPGTGVAPFRAFVQERAARAKVGEATGKLVLFYGCRSMKQDFIYQKEWKVRLVFIYNLLPKVLTLLRKI
jgi:NADPH-ferrihemoprotein reductase